MITVVNNIKQLLTLEGVHRKSGRNLLAKDLSILNDASIVIEDNEILWVGPKGQLPKIYEKFAAICANDVVITPEIVDSHTHLVFGGNRAFEYSMRLNGADYEDIAAAGGGILSTMKATVESKPDELLSDAIERIERIHSYGIGTVEIKSGYALSYAKEKEISLLIHKLKQHFQGRVQIFNTFLAAHAVPSDYNKSYTYMNDVVLPLLNELAPMNIIDAVDIFHEVGYFDDKDVSLLFDEAKKLNIAIKIHADEFNDNGGAEIACRYNALSCDHLLKTSAKGIKALSKSNTIATFLPGTAFFLGKPLADAKSFLDNGARVSLASDYNPGSCHCDNLLLIASLAAKTMNFNMAQLWSAITYNAAASLGLTGQGAIIPGMKARFSIFSCNSIDEITYNWGRNFAIDPHQFFSR